MWRRFWKDLATNFINTRPSRSPVTVLTKEANASRFVTKFPWVIEGVLCVIEKKEETLA